MGVYAEVRDFVLAHRAVERAPSKVLVEKRDIEEKQKRPRLPLPEWFDDLVARQGDLDDYERSVMATLSRNRLRGATEKQIEVLTLARGRLARGKATRRYNPLGESPEELAKSDAANLERIARLPAEGKL
jgi:hypothetical protein